MSMDKVPADFPTLLQIKNKVAAIKRSLKKYQCAAKQANYASQIE